MSKHSRKIAIAYVSTAVELAMADPGRARWTKQKPADGEPATNNRRFALGAFQGVSCFARIEEQNVILPKTANPQPKQ